MTDSKRGESARFEHQDPALTTQLRGRGYRLDRELSRGGMGVVFAATRLADGLPVALKLAASTLGLEGRLRFERERRILASLDHPHIIRALDSGEVGGRVFLVMNLISGTDLQGALRERRRLDQAFTEDEVRAFLSPIARALVCCHALGLVHRDLKPANILIEGEGGRPILIDFGVACQPGGGEDEVLTRTAQMLGTPSFMAPEQLERGSAAESVGPPADAWSLGATLFTLLAGEPPFSAVNSPALWRRILAATAPRLRERRPDVSAELDDLVARCLQRRPEDRPAMEAIAAILEGPRERPRRGIIIAAVLVFFLLLALSLAPPFEERPPLVLRVPELTLCDGSEAVRLEGRLEGLDQGQVIARPGFARAPISEGRFALDIRPSWGDKDELRYEILARSGEREARASVRLRRDLLAPVLRFELGTESFQAMGVQGLAFQALDENLRDVAWRALEEPAAPWKTLPFDGEGRGRVPTTSRNEPLRIEIRARDAVGRESRRSLWLVAPEARAYVDRCGEEEAYKAARKLLARVENWRGAEAADRRIAAFALALRLDAGFEYLGPRSADAIVARYRHRRSGIAFHLIPGGEVPPAKIARMKAILELPARSGSEEITADLRSLDELGLLPPAVLVDIGIFFRLEAFKDWADLASFVQSAEGRRRSAELVRRFEAATRPGADPEERERLRLIVQEAPDRRSVKPFLMAARETSRAEAAALGLPVEDEEAGLPATGLSHEQLRPFFNKSEPGELRLPDLDEWRHACRGGATTRYFWGEDMVAARSYAFFKYPGGPRALQRTDAHDDAANGFGLSDTLGNAGEMAQLYTDGEELTPVLGGDVRRGPRLLHRDIFINQAADQSNPLHGFRLAVSLPEESE